MKKTIIIAIVLLATVGLAFASAAPEKASTSAASGELVIYTSMSEELQEKIFGGFEEKYPGIKIEVIEGGAGELKSRVKAEAGNPQGDIITGITYADVPEMGDYFLSYYPANNANLPDEIKGERTDGKLVFFAIQCVNLIVNKKLAADLGVEIKGYEDLLDPKLKGKIISANPAASSSAWDHLATILVVMGGLGSEQSWDYVEKLAAQFDGIISGSSSACYKGVYNGEYVVGLTYEEPCINYIRDGKGDIIDLVYMEEGTTASYHASCIIKDCPNEANAKLFMDYLSSDECQSMIESTCAHRQANTSVPETATYRVPASQLKTLYRDEQYLSDHHEEIVSRWNSIWAKYSK